MKKNRSILGDSRFWPLFWTQALGAMNDNVFKNALVILITFKAYSLGSMDSKQVVAFCGGIFILPFFLFSAIAGNLSDRYSKSTIVLWIKALELLIMIIGSIGFLTENFPLLLTSLFLMGTQSAFFGPAKYGVLPELLQEKELVTGNAYIEMGTFISILLGTLVGGIFIGIEPYGTLWISVIVISFASIGIWTSSKFQKLPPADPTLKIRWKLLKPTIEILKISTSNKSVFYSILAISWFWFLGAIILSVLPPYCKEILQGDEHLVTFLLALFSIGVGLGSLVCERLSFRQLELGLVPIGSLGLTIFIFDLFWINSPHLLQPVTLLDFIQSWEGIRIGIDFFLFSFFGGLFIVPLYTLIQERSKPQYRSRVIAANNILNALFMVIGSLFLILWIQLKITIPQIFLILGTMNICVAAFIYTTIPEFLFRFISWSLAHLVYKIRTQGKNFIPKEGPAVLVCNHVSFVDWLIIASSTQRPIRFVMHYSFLDLPFTGRIFKDAKVIPIAGSKEDPEILEKSFDQISKELEDGEIVCIFPEGMITKNGKMNSFRPGIEKILKRNLVPVIPMGLIGLWGSTFSRHPNKNFFTPFQKIFSKVFLNIGKPIFIRDSEVEGFASRLQEHVAVLLRKVS